MAQSKSTKKLFNMAYGLGASIVIIGALFKILHWDFGFPFTSGIEVRMRARRDIRTSA